MAFCIRQRTDHLASSLLTAPRGYMIVQCNVHVSVHASVTRVCALLQHPRACTSVRRSLRSPTAKSVSVYRCAKVCVDPSRTETHRVIHIKAARNINLLASVYHSCTDGHFITRMCICSMCMSATRLVRARASYSSAGRRRGAVKLAVYASKFISGYVRTRTRPRTAVCRCA